MTVLCRLAPLALCVYAAVAADSPEKRGSALGADDACGADAPPGSCAVSALQVVSSRGGRGGQPEVGAAAGAAPVQQEPLDAASDDQAPGWKWPQDVVDHQMRADRWSNDSFYYKLSEAFAPRMVQHCLRYNSFFWPQMSFWSQEVLRRVEALPEDMDPARQQQIEDLSRNASFLMCNFWFDPRQGTNWSEPVSQYMRRVKALPSDSLELPLLDGWFDGNTARSDMWSGDSCMFWASSLMCDVGHLARDLQGAADHGDDLCWDKVDAPTHGFSVFNVSLQDDRPGVPDSEEDFHHPEYLACQDKPLTKDLLDHHCPMFGHYPDGYMNVSSWGHGFPASSPTTSKVLTCQKKLGIPERTPSTSSSVTHRPWIPEDGGVSLMEPPSADYVEEYHVPSKDARWSFMRQIREALEQYTPDCGGSWPCIFKTLDKVHRQTIKEDKAAAAAAGEQQQVAEHVPVD